MIVDYNKMTPPAHHPYHPHPHHHPQQQQPGARPPGDEEPVSRTYQYRKVMKPLLERKRRARINRCLDELKELMVCALQAEGENVAKLEKADILELTVNHLHRLKTQGRLSTGPAGEASADKFRAGFAQCAAEVSQFVGGEESPAGARLLGHLTSCVRRLDAAAPPYPRPLASALRQEGGAATPPARRGGGAAGYAPPSPPASPATREEDDVEVAAAPSMWRPW